MVRGRGLIVFLFLSATSGLRLDSAAGSEDASVAGTTLLEMDRIMSDNSIDDKITALMKAQLGEKHATAYLQKVASDANEIPETFADEPPLPIPKPDVSTISRFHDASQRIYTNSSIKDKGSAILAMAKRLSDELEKFNGKQGIAKPYPFAVPTFPKNTTNMWRKFSCIKAQGSILVELSLTGGAVDLASVACMSKDTVGQCGAAMGDVGRGLMNAVRNYFLAQAYCGEHTWRSYLCAGAKAEFNSFLWGMAHSVSSSTFKCRKSYDGGDQRQINVLFAKITPCRYDLMKSGAYTGFSAFQAYKFYRLPYPSPQAYQQFSLDQMSLERSRINSWDIMDHLAWTVSTIVMSIMGCRSVDWARDCGLENVEFFAHFISLAGANTRKHLFCKLYE